MVSMSNDGWTTIKIRKSTLELLRRARAGDELLSGERLSYDQLIRSMLEQMPEIAVRLEGIRKRASCEGERT